MRQITSPTSKSSTRITSGKFHNSSSAHIAPGKFRIPKSAKITSDNLRRPSATPKSVRLTGGTFRGQKLLTPSTSLTHPMSERARLAIFNMIDTSDLTVADLYAGSGALGFEALSRGAKSVIFVDNSRAACDIIKSNQKSLKLKKNLTILKSSVQNFLTQKNSFDLIFCDPPYDDFHPEDFHHLAKILRPAGTLVLSHPALFTPEIPGLTLLKTRTYASANISLLQKPQV